MAELCSAIAALTVDEVFLACRAMQASFRAPKPAAPLRLQRLKT
jgi:hypothetical protein